MTIAILEDDTRRVEAMRPVLADLAPDHAIAVFDSAPRMIAWLKDNLDRTALVSLDNDLIPPLTEAGPVVSPGCGLDVAAFLAGRPPACPVILHTANYLAAPVMEEALTHAGWRVKRVVPFFDLEWVGSAWLLAVETLLAPSRRRDGESAPGERTACREAAPNG
jgi:hypothetical protein